MGTADEKGSQELSGHHQDHTFIGYPLWSLEKREHCMTILNKHTDSFSGHLLGLET